MPNAPDPQQTSQRVKVGMIGLASVILLIAIASAILGSVSRQPAASVAAPGVEANMLADNMLDTNEPLVDLGVAPSAGNTQQGAQ